MPNVERISIECDEQGFELWIETDEDDPVCFNIHAVAVDLLAAVERTIAPWHREGMSVLAEMRAAGAFACGPEDIDESGGYALDDPKSPGFRERMADAWDNRDKTERKPW